MQRVSLHDVEEGLARARVSTHDIARTASDRHAIELATAEREGLAAPLRAQLTTLHRHSPTAGRSVALRIPCVMGRVGVVKALLADGIDPSPSASAKDSESRKPSAFEMAAKRGHVGVMRVLLQHHARGAWAECGDSAGGIDNVLRTVMGSPNNTADVIDFLVNEAGADVDARNDHGDTLLHEAVLWDSLEATVALLRHGADVEAVNDKGYTPLLIAAGFGKQSVFEALAEAGANIHHRASNGWSVLDITVIAGNLETLGALVRRKVDVRAIGPSATGSSSLHWAAIYNKEAAIDALIAAGADVNAKSAVGGQTPLHRAIICGGTPETIAALFRHGVDDGALDETGYPPLHWASMHGKISAIAALAAAGTDINRRTSQNNEPTALDCAAFLGNVDALKMLVENGADVRGSDPRGYTPLHFAVECNSVGASEASCEAITALLLHGAEVDAANKKGETPLVMAVEMGKLALVDALVAGGADVNRRNVVDDKAPLDVAAFIGNLGVLKALLGYGSRAKSVDSVGATALHHVAGFEAAGLVHALVDAGADVSAEDANGMAPIHYASISGSPTAIMALAQRGADNEARIKNGMTPLQLAAECGKVSAIDALAAAGADINLRTTTEDTSALDLAAHAGEVDAMKALIRHGANVRAGNASGYTALYFVSDVNQAASIDFLVGAGADVDVEAEQGFTPLHIASHLGFSGAVGSLLKHGADKDFTSSTGATPLHMAAEHGRLPVLNALVEAGANVWRRTQDHISALDLAAGRGHVDVLNALIRHGVDVNASDAKGYSPLYEAAAGNRVAAIRALVEAGADVHGLAQGWTPLDASCEAGAADAIATLAELGADLTRTNVKGVIPLQLAVDGGHLDAVNALLEAGADPNQEIGEEWVFYTVIVIKRRDILASFLLHGADVNKKVMGDLTVLHVAVEFEDAGAVNALLGAGADVNNGVSYNGLSALHIACMGHSTDIMLTLLSHGASIDVRDENGRPLLHDAARTCVRLDSGTDRVDVLLRAGADETARDSNDLTPAEFAQIDFFDETDRDALARVTMALERAPADRAWRRRGMVLLCRSFLERGARQPEPLTETGAPIVWRAEVGGYKDGDEAARKADAGRIGKKEGLGNFGGLMSRLFALKEEGLFRTVVGFL